MMGIRPRPKEGSEMATAFYVLYSLVAASVLLGYGMNWLGMFASK